MIPTTFNVSETEVYSEADVKAVMKFTYEDIIGFANRKLIDYERVKKWIEDITYLLNKRVLNSFEIQMYNSAGERFKCYRYVAIENSFTSGGTSGGINYYEIPSDTKFGLFADIDYSKENIEDVKKHLGERGWGINGSSLEGNAAYERSYSSGTLKLDRYEITKK